MYLPIEERKNAVYVLENNYSKNKRKMWWQFSHYANSLITFMYYNLITIKSKN